MKETVCFIHTVSGVVDTFKKLSAEFLPGVENFHIADDSLIRAILTAGGLTSEIRERVAGHVDSAQKQGATIVQFTCSTISPCADDKSAVPVLKIDEAMAEQAVALYARIGLIATNPATLKPSSELVARKAKERGRSVAIEPVLCEGAYAAFLSGDVAKHDAIVRERLTELMRRVDVILLAQASMARVVDLIPENERRIPILSSPRSAMQRLAAAVNGKAMSAKS